MGTRRQSRIIAFQALFSYDLNPRPRSELLSLEWLEPADQQDLTEDSAFFARLLIEGTLDNLEAVDAAISSHLKNWELNRIGRVDLALLRISAYALLFRKDVPAAVTIDEAIDISKRYGSAESYRFINGVLDGIRKDPHLQLT